MSDCLLYLATIDGNTKIGITHNWRNRCNGFIEDDGAERIVLNRIWSFPNRSTALSIEQLLLRLFYQFRQPLPNKKRKSEYISLSVIEARSKMDYVVRILGNCMVTPPPNKSFTSANLLPYLETELRREFRKRELAF